MLLRALGYEEAEWGKNIDSLKELTGIAIPQGTLNRGQVFDAVWPAFSTPVMKDGNILGVEKGVLENPVPPVVALEVNNVSADNLKEIKVVFNQKVDKESLIPNNFTLDGGLKAQTVVLSEDGMTAVVTVKSNMTNNKEYKLSVKGVKAEDTKAPEFAEVKDLKFTCKDVYLPEVVKVEFAGPKNLAITFNEPMKDVKGTVTIKSGTTSIAVNNADMPVSGNVVTINAFSNFAEGKEYEISVDDFVDFAGYKNASYKATYTYNKDTSAPIAEVIAADSVSVTVKFSKPVKGLKAGMFWHTFTAYNEGKLEKLDGKAIAQNDLVTTAVIRFYSAKGDKALAEGTVKFGINGDKIVDLWGNKLGTFETSVNVVVDKEAAEVKTAEADGTQFIKVTFTKEVVLKTDHITLKNSKGNKVPFKQPKNKEGKTDGHKVWYIETINDMEGEVLSLSISGAQGTTPDMITVVAFNGDVDFGDQTPPEIVKVKHVYEADKPGKLYVFFNDDVTDSALLGSNYMYKDAASKYHKLGVDGQFFGSPKVVLFELGKELSAELNAATALLASNVKDMAGNVVVSKDFSPFTGNLKPEILKVNGVEQVVAIDANTVDVTFDSDITVIDLTKFVTDAGKTPETYSQLATNKIRLHFKEADKLAGYDQAAVTDKLDIGAGAVKNQFDELNVVDNDTVIVDRIVAEVDSDANGYKVTYEDATGKITIPLTKKIADIVGIESLVEANDLVVKVNGSPVDPTNFDVELNGAKDEIYVHIHGNVLPASGYTVGVETTSGLKYLKTEGGMKLKALDYTELASTKTLLMIKKVAATGANTGKEVTITFNLDVDATTGAEGSNYTFTATNGTTVSGAPVVSGKTVTIATATGKLQQGDSLKVENLKAKDIEESVLFTGKISGEKEEGNNVWFIDQAVTDDDAFNFVD